MTQQEALAVLKMGYNVYLTGAAGSGKTWLLNAYIRFLKERGVSVGITASTGIAATHLDGLTLHSWSGMGIKESLTDAELRKLAKKRTLAKRIQETKVLIIDEVSMLEAKQFDTAEQIVRYVKGSFEPFGGMQVVLCGDFFQLPPVRSDGKPNRFISASLAWRNLKLRICYLQEQHRQEDAAHLALLTAVRRNSVDKTVLTKLRARYHAALAGASFLPKLYTHNADVDRLNAAELERLSGEAVRFSMRMRGPERLVRGLLAGCLAPAELALKKGARVMFLRNNFERGYINGTLGTVTRFDEEKGYPIVETFDGRGIIAEPERWAFEEQGKVKAELIQVPLRLAWAITVHKSQGMTLDAAEIDLSQSFEPGMGYVALSRVKALSGIRLMGLNKMALEVNQQVLAFDETLKKKSADVAEALKAMSRTVQEAKERSFLARIGAKEQKWHPTGDEKPQRRTSRLDALRKRHARAYAPWSQNEEETLALMFRGGKRISELAAMFERRPGAIRSRLRKLGLLEE